MSKFINFAELSRYRSADDSPGFLLWRIHAVWKRQIEAALLAHELTHVQFVLLAALGYLAKDGALVSQVDLAKFTSCDVAMTSQVLRSLEKRELIARVKQEGNERSKYPQITRGGLALLKPAMKVVEKVDEQFFSLLGERQASFVRLLQKLI